MSDATYTCDQCGSTIYPEHLEKKRAGRVAGKLLCPMCVTDKLREVQETKARPDASGAISSRSGVIQAAAAPAAKVAGSSGVIHAAPVATPVAAPKPPDEAEEPLSLVSEGGDKPAQSIRAFNRSSLVGADRHEQFQRGLVERGVGATRCRTFHGKLTDAALAYMDNQINEWVDAHPDVHIKFATSGLGVFEGKHTEPHFIVSVFF